MHEIRHLAEEIREELGDAEKYAREAVKHAEDPETASTYADLSRQELGHANRLHEMAVSKRQKMPVTIPRKPSKPSGTGSMSGCWTAPPM